MTVHYETRDRVALITIDRPERRNAVDRSTAAALRDAWARFDADDSAHVGILTGSGGHFSSGADLVAFDLEDWDEGWLGFTRTETTKPTVAAVEGFCVAGGLEMAVWCDIRVAAETAVFGCYERRFGVPLVDGGTQRLPRLIGHGLAMELILTGRPVDAEEAHAIGLVNQVVPTGRALAEAIRYAKRIADFPQETVRSDRAAVLGGSGLSLADGLALERGLGRDVMEVARRGAERFAGGLGRSGRHVVAAATAIEAATEATPASAETAVAAIPPPPPRRKAPSPPAAEPVASSPSPNGHAPEARTAPAATVPDPDPDAPDAEPVAEHEAVPELEQFGPPDPAMAPIGPGPTTVRVGDDDVDVWVEIPDRGAGPGVFVVHDAGGVDARALDAIRRLSEAGFVVMLADLAGAPDGDGPFGLRSAVRRIRFAVRHLAEHPAVEGAHVGLVGFGAGGGLALWYTTVDDLVRACVVYRAYLPWAGVEPDYTRTKAAFLGHYDSRDSAVSSQFAYGLEMELRDLKVDATFHVYREVDGALEDPDASAPAGLAWNRTVSFLRRSL